VQARRVLLVGVDLMAQARLEQAARSEAMATRAVAPSRLVEELEARPADVVVLDLDAGGRALLEELDRARAGGLVHGRVIGYFSHVDEELGRAARAAGCEALPRGRFWRTLAEVLSGPSSS
jgi:hypothetical protein